MAWQQKTKQGLKPHMTKTQHCTITELGPRNVSSGPLAWFTPYCSAMELISLITDSGRYPGYQRCRASELDVGSFGVRIGRTLPLLKYRQGHCKGMCPESSSALLC